MYLFSSASSTIKYQFPRYRVMHDRNLKFLVGAETPQPRFSFHLIVLSKKEMSADQENYDGSGIEPLGSQGHIEVTSRSLQGHVKPQGHTGVQVTLE